MIYPTLKDLVAGGYVECIEESTGGRVRKVCHLTPRGEEALAAGARTWQKLLPSLERTVQQIIG
jgi:DNA-binding PadR family transcriptional regulator